MKNKMNKILFANKNLIFNIIIFFFITIIFLNYIHNSYDPYVKIDLKFNNEDTFVKNNNPNIKQEISKKLISDEAYKHIIDRKCEITGDFHDRHKVRWVKSLFLKKIYNFTNKFNENLPYYTNIFLHSFIIFFTLLILNKTFNFPKKYNLIFLLYVTFIFQQSLSEYSYSIFETFFFSLSLYASKNKKNLLFLLSCLLATLNRESGIIITFSWLIFNYKFKELIFFISIILLFFISINFEIIKCLINPKFFIPLESQRGQVNLSDLNKINLFSFVKLWFVNFLLPFGIGIYYLVLTEKKNKILILLFFIYLLIFFIATPIHHISVRLILIPLIYTAIYFYRKNRQKKLLFK